MTKIRVPTCDDAALRRPRAESVLDRGKRVTTVIGPAGFGKTMAVAKWASRENAAVAWYTIDAYDNRPTVFWRHLHAAINHAHQLPDDDNVVERPPDGGSFAAPLLHAIGPEPKATVLVLDDLHSLGE